MNQMKQFWDEKHPELNSLTSKNLRDYVSSIIKHKVVMETDFDLQNQNTELIVITVTQQLMIIPLSMTLQEQIIHQL